MPFLPAQSDNTFGQAKEPERSGARRSQMNNDFWRSKNKQQDHHNNIYYICCVNGSFN